MKCKYSSRFQFDSGILKAKFREMADPDSTNIQSRKIFVNNIDYKMNKTDLRVIFSIFGEVRSVIMPEEDDGDAGKSKSIRKHRGFAFVEFETYDAAKRALQFPPPKFYGRQTNISVQIPQLRHKSKRSKRKANSEDCGSVGSDSAK